MSARKDLTRWNRAGLSRFRYVDGNAVEYLELLRQGLVEKFADPVTQRCEWLNPAEKLPADEQEPDNETLIQRQLRLRRTQERILESYHQDRRDWAWEISRTFARACHILTGYADAYANEGYLGTATQWDHVRRLVEMLDYHPAPPASATTPLVFLAKDMEAGKQSKAGIVGKGFQVKYSPQNGGAKVIFETLEDLIIDPALDALRPKGWDQSDEPTVPAESDGGSQAPDEERQFSSIANGPAIDIQGVGPVSAATLDTLKNGDDFKIKDFLDLNPDSSEINIVASLLWEWKAKADVVIDFAPEGNWSVVAEWLLPELAAVSAESLAERSGNSLERAEALKLNVEMVAVCLDQTVYEVTRLKQLFAPLVTVAGTVVTSWYAVRKPDVVPDEVAMLMDKRNNLAGAVAIDRVDKSSVDESIVDIHLRPSPVQYNWKGWPRGKTTFSFTPRWEKKCWLNGSNVIRTKEPHGLAAEAFVSWKVSGAWKFAKVIEVDKRNLRLEFSGTLPVEHTPLYEVRPLDGPNLPAEIEEVGLIDEELPADAIEDVTAADLQGGDTPELPIIISTGPTDSVDPLSSIPGLFGKLPEVGSFIVPTPMLPMDLVKAAVKLLLKMGVMVIPSTGKPVFEFAPPDELAASIYQLVIDSESVAWEEEDEATVKQAIEVALTSNLPTDPEPVFFKKISEAILEKGPFLVIPKEPPIKAIVDSITPRYVVEGSPDKIANGDWVIGEFSDGLRALRVAAVTAYADVDKAERFSLSFENLVGTVGELKKLHADFRGELVAEGAAVNVTSR